MRKYTHTFGKITALLMSVGLFACTSTTESKNDTLQTNITGFVEGATVVALVNIHADDANDRLYAINYQMQKLIPMCSQFVIKDIGKKEIEISHNGTTYSYILDKYTRKAGQSLKQNFNLFFGDKCDSEKVKQLSEIDQKGIKKGRPIVGMTKEGVKYAMGLPPIHGTTSLDSNRWTYWVNRWARNIMEFDENGKLETILK